jgi:hypothetical protein
MAGATNAAEVKRFVAMRFKRIKTWGHIYHVRRHNTREMECRHVDKDAPPPRFILGGSDAGGAIRKVLDRYGVKHKPGEVLALEFVVSTSREVFEGLEERSYGEQLGYFLACSLQAFFDRFKIEDQIVSVALHEDERTPHLHVVVVPLICEPDNRRRDRAPSYRLSAKRIIGGRGDMSREQTRFATFFEGMGLQRGKERSGARHVNNREHEAMLEVARQAALAEKGQMMAERDRFVGATVELDRRHNALADQTAELEAQRTILREEHERLAAVRVAMMQKTKEAEALKSRALQRTALLRDLLAAGEELRSFVLTLPEKRRTADLSKAFMAASQFDLAVREATQADAWLVAALAHRARGATASR